MAKDKVVMVMLCWYILQETYIDEESREDVQSHMLALKWYLESHNRLCSQMRAKSRQERLDPFPSNSYNLQDTVVFVLKYNPDPSSKLNKVTAVLKAEHHTMNLCLRLSRLGPLRIHG